MKQKIAGIIVAGGLSTRMGRDKASLPWDGGTMLSTVLEKLNPVCSELIVVSNVHRDINYLPVIIVPDEYPQCGPLAGIHAGLLAAHCDYAFVVACDMPYLNTQTAGFIMETASEYDAAIPFIDGYYHPLHGVYRKSCIPFIEQRLKDGIYRVTDFFNDINVRKITREEIAVFDPALQTLHNINSPDDLNK